MRAVPDIAFAFVKSHEGCKLVGYPDSGGVATWGYGHTGPEVRVGGKVTQAMADTDLRLDLAIAARRLGAAVEEAVILSLTDHQYAALLSFVFNLGCDPKWTIWKLLNGRKFDQVPAQLNRFVNAGGQKVQGLVNRRAAEVVLWSTEEPGSVPDALSSGLTRAAPTPPTPAPVPKTGLSAHVVTCVSVAGAACAQYAEPAKKAAAQLAGFTGAPIIQHAVTILLTVAGVATLVGIASSELQRRAAKQ